MAPHRQIDIQIGAMRNTGPQYVDYGVHFDSWFYFPVILVNASFATFRTSSSLSLDNPVRAGTADFASGPIFQEHLRHSP